MEQILESMKRAAAQIDGTSTEPDRSRTDWNAVSSEVDALVAKTRPWVLAESETAPFDANNVVDRGLLQ